MAQFRESGITNEVTTGNLSADAYFVMATAVGTLDDVVPQPVFFDWLIDPSGPIEYTTSVGIGIADDSVTEAMLTPAVQAKLNASGGTSRKDGFDAPVTFGGGTLNVDLSAGTYDNKSFEFTGSTTIALPTNAAVGEYKFFIYADGNTVDWAAYGWDQDPTLSSSDWTLVSLYYTPDSTWTW